MNYLGIDPGQSGGIALIGGRSINLWPMPADEVGVWGLISREVKRAPNVKAVIEAVHAMPGNGVAGMFKFGLGVGGLRMALVAAGVEFISIHPNQWQRQLGVEPRRKHTGVKKMVVQRGKHKGKMVERPCGGESYEDFKERLCTFAQHLYPKQQGITLKTCDALLLATWLSLTTKE